MLCKKIVILYANDMDSFVNERGFYFDMKQLPFPLTTSNSELVNLIRNTDLNKIINRYPSFEQKLGLKENGNACRQIANLIEKIVS